MPQRTLNVQITGDDRDLQRALKRSDGALDRFGKQTSLHARVSSKGFTGIGLAARGMTAGIGAAVVAGGFLTKQFVESNKVAQQTNAVLKSTGGAAGVTAKQVSDLATSISRKTGMDDEAIQSGENLLLTFTNIHNETGRGNQIFTRATRTIADMSAALGQETKSSAIQLGKALNDPIKGVTALQRVGVSFTQSQRDQIKTLVESGHTLDAQKIILRELGKEFGGSAAAIATPFDKLKVSVGNLAETVGGFLAPTLGKAANATNRFLNQMQDGTGTGGKFVRAMQNAAAALKDAWQTSVAAVRRFIARNRDDIDSVIQAMKNLAKAAQYWFREVIVPVVRVEIRALGRILNNVVEIFRGVIRIVSGVLTGDWSKAWQGVKDVVGGTVRGIGNVLRGAVEVMGEIAVRIGKQVVKGILLGLRGLGSAIKKKVGGDITDALGDLPVLGSALKIGKGIADKVGDGVGKVIGPSIGTLGSRGPFGGLHGADGALRPVAGIASRFGLGITSGRDDHSTMTSSGNLSYHATGEALDFSNGYETPQEMAFARYMVSRFGGRLAELIYTPLGFSIKDGQKVPPIAAGEHHNHVHVAMDLGRPGPGIGDGRGKRKGDGIGFSRIERLWLRAGGSRRVAPLMAHIAMAESAGDPNAVNPSGATGLWQILGQPFRGNPRDPLTNARMAVWKYNHQGLGAWEASRSVWGKYVGGGGTSLTHGGGAGAGGGGGYRWPGESVARHSRPFRGGSNRTASTGGGGGGGGGTKPVALVGPGHGGYEQRSDDASLAEATARSKNNLAGLIKALQSEIALKRHRLKTIRKALRRRLRPETRKRLTEEAATLTDDLGTLRETLTEFRADAKGGAKTISRAEQLEHGRDPDLPEKGVIRPGGTMAGVDADTSGDTTGGDTGSGVDPNQALIDATTAHTDALTAVGIELKRQTDLAQQWATTSEFTKTKFLADIMSGQFGRGILSRRFTPGTGVEYAY